jgi:hypothetical protein
MGLSLTVAASAVLSAATVASADVKATEPRMMVITKDGAALRCDTGNIYYAVRTLKAGDLVKVDGEGGGWVRAEYPTGTRAYVRADEASFDNATKTVKLLKGTKLMAANELGARPWWPLMDKDVAAGTAFSMAEPVKAADGATEGYLIPAPAGAHGYIKSEQVRTATAAEMAVKPTPAAPVAVTPKPAETKPVEAAAKPAETKPTEVAAKPAETPKPIETPVAAPTPAPKPTEIVIKPAEPAPTPAATPTATPAPAQEIVEVKPAPTPAPTEVRMTTQRTTTVTTRPQVTQRIDDVGVLRDMFERAMQPESDGAEITTVISEFNRKIDALPTSGDDGKIRVALSQRLEALRMRQDVAETRRKLSDTSAIDDRMRQVHLAINEAQKQAIYAIVGRMLPSTVYDGKRGMPLMYRVESADFSSTRTIGYVIPREGMDFLPVMGKIVGIVGETRMDPALGLNIVMPTRVDEMRVTAGKLEVVPNAISMPTAPVISPAPGMPGSTSPTTPGGTLSKPADPEPKGEPVASPTPDMGDINK